MSSAHADATAHYRDALERIVAIAAQPRDSMTWNRHECERRGQAMMTVAAEALRRGRN